MGQNFVLNKDGEKMADKYIINEYGKVITNAASGHKTLERALLIRLKELKRNADHELELDYDKDTNTWYAMDYISDSEQAFNMTDHENKSIIAVKDLEDNGVVIYILDMLDIGYVY